MTLRRLAFLTGFGCGYLLGARAGRDRYDHLVAVARRLADQPAVQSAAGMIAAQVSGAVHRAGS